MSDATTEKVANNIEIALNTQNCDYIAWKKYMCHPGGHSDIYGVLFSEMIDYYSGIIVFDSVQRKKEGIKIFIIRVLLEFAMYNQKRFEDLCDEMRKYFELNLQYQSEFNMAMEAYEQEKSAPDSSKRYIREFRKSGNSFLPQ